MIKSFYSKQIVNQTSNTISTNKNWKQFKQTKSGNKTNTVSFVSA